MDGEDGREHAIRSGGFVMLTFVFFCIAAFIGYLAGRRHEKALQQVARDVSRLAKKHMEDMF